MKINHSICPLDGDWLGHRPADLGCHLLSSENDGDDDKDNGDDDDDEDEDGGGDDDVDVNCDNFNGELESEFFDYFRNVRAKWNSNQSVDISTGIMHMFEFVTRKYDLLIISGPLCPSSPPLYSIHFTCLWWAHAHAK